MSRIDARPKASGMARYVADVDVPGMAHAAIVRATVPHGRILAIDTERALACEGVIAVVTAKDVSAARYGRGGISDVPILATEVVRFVGEKVAAVVAEDRRTAEYAAGLVEVTYEELPSVTTLDEALAPGATAVHERPWEYAGAVIKEGDGNNLQSIVSVGDRGAAEGALERAAHVVDETYATPGGHHGYIEPQACIAKVGPDGGVKLWLTNKGAYSVRSSLAKILGLDAKSIEIEPIALGGDFGGKGSLGDSPLCVELSRLTGRPVKLVMRYSEDLIAGNPRHPSRTRVRIGSDQEGRIVAVSMEMLLNGGAYGGYKPNAKGIVAGAVEAAGYRIPAFFVECRAVYTNTVPRGHMRAPGAPQFAFAFESALDELAVRVGIDGAEIRRRNLLHTGETDANGHTWVEFRGNETLEAALAAFEEAPAPEGWRKGTGIALYSRSTRTSASTSLRLVPLAGGGLRVEIPFIENGAGGHTAMRNMIAAQLGFRPELVEVVQVATSELPKGNGVGGSGTTATIAFAADAAAKAWRERTGDEPIVVDVDGPGGQPVGSYGVQIAQVAVDPETGQVAVLEILSAVDVAEIINPLAHQIQIDGGSTMGFGFACLEDLDESDGHVWAANLGDFKLPSARDVPRYRTVLVRGAKGVGASNIKNIGETTNPPTAAAIANAIFAATGCRLRELPLSAERVFSALQERSSVPARDLSLALP